MKDFKQVFNANFDTDVGYLVGKARNEDVDGDGTGSPWHQIVINDLMMGPVSALFNHSDVVADNSDEKAEQSQWVDALKTLAKDMNWGDSYKGSFEKGFTYTSADDVGRGQDGKYYKYIGGDPFPKSTPAGLNPTSFPSDYELSRVTDHNNDTDRNAVGAHDDIYSRKIPSIESLLSSLISKSDGLMIELQSYHGGWAGLALPPVGGGLFVWDGSGDKSEHDGGCIIDPDVPFYTLGNEPSVHNWYRSSNVGIGVWRRIIKDTITDDMYGVIQNDDYVYNEAFVNRYAYETMLRNQNYSDFTFSTKVNPVFIWGSVNVGRSDLTIRHLSGCDIRGRYSDPSEITSGQAGHMFGFVDYTDPYPNTDYSIAGSADRVNYILDGKASTIFNSGHTQLHNNNAIAFYKGTDCSVTGKGGIPTCDHNGIAFDGLSINPKVDVAYVRNYDDRAVTMKGDPSVECSATVKIGEIKGKTGNGSVSESVLVQDLSYAKVEIGNSVLFSGSLGTFVNSINCDLVDINYGYLENAVFVCAITNTGKVNIDGGRYKNVTYQVRRGGTAPETKPLRKISLKNSECVESNNSAIYISQITPNEGVFDELEVVNCDFSKATGSFTPYVNKVGLSQPALYNFINNKVNNSWVYDASIYNKKIDRVNIPVGSSSFVYDIRGTNGDNPYENLTIICTHSGDSFRYKIDINLKDLLLTGAQYRASTVSDDGSIIEVTTARSGTSVTFSVSASAGTAFISSYSKSN